MCMYYTISATQPSKKNVVATYDYYNHGYILLNKSKKIKCCCCCYCIITAFYGLCLHILNNLKNKNKNSILINHISSSSSSISTSLKSSSPFIRSSSPSSVSSTSSSYPTSTSLHQHVLLKSH